MSLKLKKGDYSFNLIEKCQEKIDKCETCQKKKSRKMRHQKCHEKN